MDSESYDRMESLQTVGGRVMAVMDTMERMEF